MIKQIRQRGFEDGYKAGKKKKQELQGLSIKQLIICTFADDRKITKLFMKEYGICRTKAFRFALKYVSEFDRGVRESTYTGE